MISEEAFLQVIETINEINEREESDTTALLCILDYTKGLKKGIELVFSRKIERSTRIVKVINPSGPKRKSRKK